MRKDIDFKVESDPRTLDGARDLRQRDKHRFRKRAVKQVDGLVTTRKGSDGGICGRINFDLPGHDDRQGMVPEMTGGANAGVGAVRDLRGVSERDTAEMAGPIVMDESGDRKTKTLAMEMAQAGDLNVIGVQHSRMQISTVQQLPDGKPFVTPSVARGKGQAQPAPPLALT